MQTAYQTSPVKMYVAVICFTKFRSNFLQSSAVTFLKVVKAVIQVVGLGTPPKAPSEDDLRKWYASVSCLKCPHLSVVIEIHF